MKPMRSISKLIPMILLILITAVFIPSTAPAYEILIEVAPNVLNLQSSGTVVTVHTNVAYSEVVASSVFLNNVAVAFTKADNQGYFVAKFTMEDIKSLPLEIGAENTLLLIGMTDDGLTFSGSAEIKVINVLPKGR